LCVEVLNKKKERKKERKKGGWNSRDWDNEKKGTRV